MPFSIMVNRSVLALLDYNFESIELTYYFFHGSRRSIFFEDHIVYFHCFRIVALDQFSCSTGKQLNLSNTLL